MSDKAIWWTSKDFDDSASAADFLRSLPSEVVADARVVATITEDQGPEFDYIFQLQHGNSFGWAPQRPAHHISVFYREPFHFRFLGEAMYEAYILESLTKRRIAE
jgi:hypothetical protein